MQAGNPQNRVIVIVGDLHLVDFEKRRKGSRGYKDPAFSQDESFSAFLDSVRSGSEGPLTLIINGDFIDFDLIYLGAGIDVVTAGRKLEKILEDHSLFFESLLRLLSERENRVVLILGNHDSEFCQGEFLDAFFLRLSELSGRWGQEALAPDELRARLTIEPWFFYERDLLYVEHGDRFDRYAASPRSLTLGKNPGSNPLLLSLGSLSNRHLLKDLPTFNPLMSQEVIRDVWGYLGHLIGHYPFPPYRLPLLYLRGAMRTFAAARRQRRDFLAVFDPTERREELQEVARAKGLQRDTVVNLWRLGKPSAILGPPLQILHVLWLDWVLILSLAGLGFAIALLIGGPPWVLLALLTSSALLLWLYGRAWERNDVLKERKGLKRFAGEIAQILRVPHVILAHTHVPEQGTCPGGSRYLNTGSWATIFEDPEGSRLWSKGKSYVHLVVRQGRAEAHLMRWTSEGAREL